jgi:hypothetical protein
MVILRVIMRSVLCMGTGEYVYLERGTLSTGMVSLILSCLTLWEIPLEGRLGRPLGAPEELDTPQRCDTCAISQLL